MESKLNSFIGEIIDLETGPVKRSRNEGTENAIPICKRRKRDFNIEKIKSIIELKKNRRNCIKNLVDEIEEKVLELNFECIHNFDKKSNAPDYFSDYNSYSNWLLDNFLYELSKLFLIQYENSIENSKIIILDVIFKDLYIKNTEDILPYIGQFAIFIEKSEFIEEKNPFSFFAKLRRHNFGVGLKVSSNKEIPTGKEFNMIALGSLSSEISEFSMISLIEKSSLIKYILDPSEPADLKKFPQLNNHLKAHLTRNLNYSQLFAVKEIFSIQQGISLLIGPPGTRKTYMILNFVWSKVKNLLKQEIKKCEEILECWENSDENEDKITDIFTKYLEELKKALTEFRESRASEYSKNTVEGLILKNSDIYFTTLNNAESWAKLRSITEIGTVIIDEAYYSTELSSLIPFIFNPQQVILVGHPSQLPATTFEDSRQIEKRYNRSMFERLKERGMDTITLMNDIESELSRGTLKSCIKQPSNLRSS